LSLRNPWVLGVAIAFFVAVASAQALGQPAVNAVWPRTGPVGGGTPLTVVGSGFASSTPTVAVDGVAATPVTVVSDSVLHVTAPAVPGGVTTTGAVVVTNASGTSTASSPLNTFTYRSGPALAVPAYFYALTPGWTALDGPPRTADLAVLNPASGPGTAQDPYYVQQVQASQAAGIDVVGYVNTDYGARSLSSVEADISTFERWYGVNGIFLDQAATDCGTEASYYAPLYAFIHSQPGLDLTVLNPGSDTNACYMTASDLVLSFEGTPSDLASTSGAIPGYDPSHFWAAVYGTSASSLPSVLSTLAGDGFGNVFVTNLGLPNPYGALPNYWSQEVSDVGQVLTPPPTQTAPAITQQPTSQSVSAGQTATFTAAASGVPTPTVQWQVSSGGGAWTPLSGATSTTLTLSSVPTAMSGNQYRAVFTNGVGTPATTSAATLTVTAAPAPPVFTSPSSLTTPSGQSFSFTVTATGTPTPTLSESGRLPRAVSFSAGPAGRATLSGRSGTRRGTYTFTIIATSGGQQTTQQFTLTLT